MNKKKKDSSKMIIAVNQSTYIEIQKIRLSFLERGEMISLGEIIELMTRKYMIQFDIKEKIEQ